MKPFTFILLSAMSLRADLTLTPAPDHRGEADTAFAIFDNLDTLGSDGSGSSVADDSFNLPDAGLTQSTSIASPGGLKFNTFTDRRVYTFDATTNWTITADPSVPYNTATLRIHEYGGGQPGSAVTIGAGLTDYTYSLNGLAPSSLTAEVFIFNEGTAAERYEYVTTALWQLPLSSTDLDLNIIGFSDAHDSIDSFILDLDTNAITSPSPPPSPELTVSASEVIISWPSESSASLESSTDLTNPEAWQPVTTAPSTHNGKNQVSLPISAVASFFRLRQ